MAEIGFRAFVRPLRWAARSVRPRPAEPLRLVDDSIRVGSGKKKMDVRRSPARDHQQVLAAMGQKAFRSSPTTFSRMVRDRPGRTRRNAGSFANPRT